MPAVVLEHHQAGRLIEAEALYRQVLAVSPRHPDALHLLGVVAYQTGRHALAAYLIQQAIVENPNAAIFHGNLGNALKDMGRHDQAITALQQAAALEPGSADHHYNLALALRVADRLSEAEAHYRAAIKLHPSFPEALDSLGAVLREQGRFGEAAACHRAALALRPGFVNAMCNLGTAVKEQGRLDEAVEWLSAALAIDSEHSGSNYNLGVVMQQQGRAVEAAICYRRAIAALPDFAEAHFGLALNMLSQGNMTEGWREYDWRWKTADFARVRREFTQPLWQGEAGRGRILLIHAEQGLGDTLQFCRYVPLAVARGFKVVLEVQPSLVRLLRGVLGASAVIAHGDERPWFDVQCPMLSLPLALETVETTPWSGPYLKAEPDAAAATGARLSPLADVSLRVGLVWSGAPAMKADRRRSMRPDLLAGLLGVPGIAFFSLQKGGVPFPAGLPLIDLMGEMHDFADTAALVANLDVVVSVDTAVAHLAAAMGKPVWLLNRSDPCWRWIRGRLDTPWYPTMRVYQQATAGDWTAVLAEVRRDLAAI